MGRMPHDFDIAPAIMISLLNQKTVKTLNELQVLSNTLVCIHNTIWAKKYENIVILIFKHV